MNISASIKALVVVFALGAGCFTAPAQGIRRQLGRVIGQGENKENRMIIPAQSVGVKSQKQMDDVRLYRNIIRKNNWYVGVGEPLTAETAAHLPFYFRLSMCNDRGHWQHIEALHADTMTNAHHQSIYVLDKDNDVSEANARWRERLQRVTQWFMVPDLDGNLMLEERGLDPDGTIIYSYIPVVNADGTVTGSYNDSWGLPVDTRVEEGTTYGSVVHIVTDACGRDSIVDFLDGTGRRKYNNNRVDQQRYRYDDSDRVTLVTSHNMVGDLTTDNWGNAGVRYEYDDAARTVSRTVLDRNMRPVRMPALRAGYAQTYIRAVTSLDEWGRDKTVEMFDAEGNPDETTGGIHRIEYEYASDGRLLRTRYFNLKGEERL